MSSPTQIPAQNAAPNSAASSAATQAPLPIHDPIHILGNSLRFHAQYIHLLVRDLTPEQMTQVPGPGHENHPAFTVGHIVTAFDLVAQGLGLPSDLPPGWHELLFRAGPKDRRLPAHADYPNKEQLFHELARQQQRIIDGARAKPACWFAEPSEPWPLSKVFPSNFESALFMIAHHSALHFGQLAAWRRAMGLPAALAQV